MDIDPAKLARARAVLGTPSDTATVDAALDAVVFHREVSDALERLAAVGGLADAFGREKEVRRRERQAAAKGPQGREQTRRHAAPAAKRDGRARAGGSGR